MPTSEARFVRQDDLFGEDQAPGANPDAFGEPRRRPAPRVPGSRVPNSRVPEARTPIVQPPSSPRENRSNTDSPIPRSGSGRATIKNERRSADSSRRRSRQAEPQLPPGGNFTPNPDSIPEMPMPGGQTRSTEKARSIFDKDDVDLEAPEDFDDLEDFDIDDMSESEDRTDRRTTEEEYVVGRRRPQGSNVYRPAPDPSHYTQPTDESLRNYQLYAEQYFLQYGQYPPPPNTMNPYALFPKPSNTHPAVPNPYAANYAANPYAAHPYAGVPYAGVPHAGANYGANPAFPSVAGGFGCPTCPTCPTVQPTLLASANCGCQPDNGGMGQSFLNPVSTCSQAAVADDVYSGVVCGDREIAQCSPSVSAPSLAATNRLRGGGPLLFYSSVFVGGTGFSNLNLSGEDGNIDIGDEDGVALGFAFGQIQGKNLRSEVEVTYRTNDLNGFNLQNLDGDNQFLSGAGTLESFAVMFNVFWDFVDVPSARFKPYLGGGIGGVSVDTDFQINGIERFDDGSDTSLAYQWIGGVNYRATQYSNLFVEYRYFAADSLHLTTTLPANSIVDGDGELNYRTNNILFGMRMKF